MSEQGFAPKVSRRNFLRSAAATALAPGLLRAGELPQRLTDDQLLDKVQKQTLKYFTEFAEPNSGMARESSDDTSTFGKDIVAVGGSGFGVMGLITGAARGFIGREQAHRQLTKMVNFLETADQHHGIFPHWLNGKTGKTFVFSGSIEDGADLVETSFLMMGLLTARQYFNRSEEKPLREKINKLWERADWNFHTKEGAVKELIWHWSPTRQWAQNLPIKGWNEALITHILAASSPTHATSPDVYHEGWASGNDMRTARTYKDVVLPLGPKGGGPLFMSHYSFMGLDPNSLKDKYADYGKQNTAHTLINLAHCVENPNKHEGYSDKCWGLTSSFNHQRKGTGYSDHSPTNDVGVIAPTASLCAFPYTPRQSMAALRHMHDDHDPEKIWGKFGFVDAFKADKSWYATTYLAIDQGPIISMIENHRSQLLWNLFMSCPEVKAGLGKLGFESPHLSKPSPPTDRLSQNWAPRPRDSAAAGRAS